MTLSGSDARSGQTRFHRAESAVVLLEVILALALFAATAAIVTGGINSSVNAVERMRFSVHAGNLAATVISEIKLGDRPALMLEPEPFDEPFTNWTCQILAGSGDEPGSPTPFQQVEVVIRNVALPFEFRFGELLSADPDRDPGGDPSTESSDDL